MTTPTTPHILTLGDREYELVPFLEPGETSVSGDEMVKRANRLDANLGEDDCRHILAHQAEIPAELRKKIILIFTAWRSPGDPRNVAYSDWSGRQWERSWGLLTGIWSGVGRLVRRPKSASSA